MTSARQIHIESLSGVKSKRTGRNAWGLAHVCAMRQPVGGAERAIGHLLRGLVAYVDGYKEEFDSHVGSDYVLGEHVKDVALSIIGLLNGPTGRLDCGTVDREIRELCKLAEIDLDV